MKSGLICHLGTIEDFHALYLDKVESPLSKPTERPAFSFTERSKCVMIFYY